jgi:hypothetical protein
MEKVMLPYSSGIALQALQKPWDRQPQESHKAFAAFVIYRNLAGDRTYQEVAQMLRCSGSNVRRWAAKWAWNFRAHEWDTYQDQKAQEALIRERVRMAERQAQNGMTMQSIAAAEMERLLSSLEASKLGKRRGLSASEIAKFMEIGSRIERSARGESGADSVAKIEVIFGNSEDDDEEFEV